MADPRRVRPDELEILVARELRKAGLELARLALRARHALDPDDPSEYTVELGGTIVDSGGERELLVECRNTSAPVDADAVRAFGARLLAQSTARDVADGPKRLSEPAPPSTVPALERTPSPPPLAIMVSMSGYEAAAVREAKTLGVTLLTIADGRAAFVRSPWAVGGQPPAWVPEYMAELVDLDPAGAVRQHPLASGQPRRILGR